MRVSKAFIPTVKETPQEAEIPSHKLMLRAGLMRKVASGFYEYLPLGQRVILKVMEIIRQEMERAGAQEVLMPIMTPAELWQETGRWQKYGKELMRVKDRHERDYALGPTHEEVITDMVRRELKSYKQLPMNLFQIATKFRDEVRPRFGVMRSREFLMKDGYSFDVDDAACDKTYWAMFEAYKRIFKRCGLLCSPVEADSGLIGGSFTHEFMVLAETGEAAIALCEACGYAANMEKAQGNPAAHTARETGGPHSKVLTPGKHTVQDVGEFLKLPDQQFIKTLIFIADGKPVAVLVRGDHEVNEVKVKNHLGAAEMSLAGPEKVVEITKAPVGFAGPVDLKGVKVIADKALQGGHQYVTGGLEKDVHLTNVEFGRDFPEPEWGDFRDVVSGDGCPKCGKPLKTGRGIEVGQTFKLGLKYSSSMHCVYLGEDGKDHETVMGCYGIGVTRTVGAAIEQHHDENGILWPISLAPYQVHLLCLNPAEPEVAKVADQCYEDLKKAGYDVLYDDRMEASAGFKFKDADLLGMPLSVRVGARGLKEGVIEVKRRREKDPAKAPVAQVLDKLKDFAAEEWKLCTP
ncbi:MAG TPA: proline--tRNA ligase [bacterium]|nr:proline--tRNA ligase [bacterium]